MTAALIVIAAFVALVLVMAVRHDRRQRHMNGWSDGRQATRNTRIENQTRADEWGSRP